MARITLEHLEAYAKVHFPVEFDKLPEVDSVKFETFDYTGTERNRGSQIAGKRLWVGQTSLGSTTHVWFYGDNSLDGLYYNRSHERTLFKLASISAWQYDGLRYPFSSAIGPQKINGGIKIMSIHGLEALVKYYFVAKGALHYYDESPHGLVMFEWAIKSVSKRHPQPFVNWDNIKELDRQACEKILRIQRLHSPNPAGPMTSSQNDNPQRRLLGSSSSPSAYGSTPVTPAGLSAATGGLGESHSLAGNNHPIAGLDDSGSELNESNGRKGAHISRMRSIFQDREKERIRTNDSLQKVTAEKDALNLQVCNLQADNDKALRAAEVQFAREKADLENQLLSMSTQIASLNKDRFATGAKVEELEEKLDQEQKLRLGAEEKLGAQSHMLAKSHDLFAYQKELLMMQTEGQHEVQASVLKDLESEFGIFRSG